MNPSPQAIAYIRAQSPDWSHDDATIAAALNAQAANNPVATAPQVPAPVYESALLAKLTDPSNGSLVKLVNWPNFAGLKADIDAGNRDGIGLWCQALALAGIITAGEESQIVAYLGSAVPDPSWTATLPAPAVALGRTLDALDVAASRPGA